MSSITTGLALDPSGLRFVSFPALQPRRQMMEHWSACPLLGCLSTQLLPGVDIPPLPLTRYRWNRRKSDPRFLYHKTFIIILKKCYCKFESMIFLMWSSSHPAWSYRPGWSIVGTCLLNSRLKCPLMQRNLFHLSGSLSVSRHSQLYKLGNIIT